MAEGLGMASSSKRPLVKSSIKLSPFASKGLALGSLLTLLAGPALAQDSAVTQAEAAKVFSQVGAALHEVAGAKAPHGSKGAKTVASRAYLVQGLYSLFTAARPKFSFTPMNLAAVPKAVKWTGVKAADKELRDLIAWGCVAPVGPLATGKAPGLSCEQFGDAVGMLVVRLSDLTHTPSSRWSPYLTFDNMRPKTQGKLKDHPKPR